MVNNFEISLTRLVEFGKGRFKKYPYTEYGNELRLDDEVYALFGYVTQMRLLTDEIIEQMILMAEHLNDNLNEFNGTLDSFLANFDGVLSKTLTTILTEWQESGKLSIIIDEALQTQMDDLEKETQAKLDSFSKNEYTRSKIGINAYWGDADTTTGDSKWVATQSEIKKQLDQMVGIIDEIAIVIHLSYRPETNDFVVIQNLENLKYGIGYAASLGIKTTAIKVHCRMNEENFNFYGSTKFFNMYKEKIQELANEFLSFNIPYFVAFNELNYLYKSSSIYLTQVHEILTLVKNLGYQVLITTNDIWDFKTLNKETINLLSAVSINLYPKLSNKLTKTTYGDSISGWNEYTSFFEYLNTLNKKIIVSEFGCVDNWQALDSTGGWSFDSFYNSSGFAQDICYRGFLESNIPSYLDSAWIWFYQGIHEKPIVKQTFTSYHEGVI